MMWLVMIIMYVETPRTYVHGLVSKNGHVVDMVLKIRRMAIGRTRDH